MPTIPGIPGPYRFFFFSFDCNEPMHVHVERDRESCKFWLEPLTLASNYGFNARELTRIRGLLSANLGAIRNAWNQHCGGSGTSH
jgi:hypothetical protein